MADNFTGLFITKGTTYYERISLTTSQLHRFRCLVGSWERHQFDAAVSSWRTFVLGFPTGRDSTTFRDNGTEISSLSRDKGTTGQAQNFATGRDGTGFWQLVPSRPGTSRGTELREKTLIKWNFFLWFPVLEHLFLFWNILFCLRTSFTCFRTSFFLFWNAFFLFWNVLFLFFCSFGKVILSRDGTGQRSLSRDICSCPCPGTKGHRDKNFFLSRDKGTTGRPVPVCPGTSRGTSRPVETLISITYA